MTAPNSYLDDFMDKMVTVPNDINRFLRLIRKLDKRAQELQASLVSQQARFLQQVKELKERKITELTPALKAEQENIAQKHKELFGFMKEKKEVSDQLSTEVAEYNGQLFNQLKGKCKGRPEDQIFQRKRSKMGASKMPQQMKKEDFYYVDTKEGQYCYCGRHSFGEMVACENPYCEREWFHTVCLEEKNLPQKWYCADCQRQRDKTKNPNSRGYFVNREPTA